MMPLVLLALLFAWSSFAAAQAPSGTPNKPAGAVTILDTDWNGGWNANTTNQGNGWVNNYPGCQGALGTDSTAPRSAPGVFIETRHAGTNSPPPTGGCSIIYNFAPTRNLYGAMWYKVSNPYSGVQGGGTKLAGYMQQQAGNFVGIAFNGQNTFIRTWYNGFYSGWGGNCQLSGNSWFYDPRAAIGDPECAFSGSIFPNVATIGGGLGTWTLVEWYFQQGTCQTCNNGIHRVWVNGQLSINVTNYNYPDSPFTAWGMTHTWDGVNLYVDPSITDRLYTDHMYLATVGGTPQPLDNPPGPPGTVTGVTVTVQ